VLIKHQTRPMNECWMNDKGWLNDHEWWTTDWIIMSEWWMIIQWIMNDRWVTWKYSRKGVAAIAAWKSRDSVTIIHPDICLKQVNKYCESRMQGEWLGPSATHNQNKNPVHIVARATPIALV